MLHQFLSYLAAVVGLLSAVLWWIAATVVVKAGDPGVKDDMFWGDVAIMGTFRKQSKFNAAAAIATGISAALSAALQLFG